MFQIDFEGNSTLAYACRHNQTTIAEFFINSGLNIDRVTYNGRKALYYALENRNEQLVRTLLRAGATPWSNEKNPFSRLLQHLPKRFSFLFRNARKIWLARAFMKDRTARYKIWDDNKVYISGDRQFSWDNSAQRGIII